jgi:protein Mpv17
MLLAASISVTKALVLLYRYEYLDRIIRRRFQPNTFKFVASKVAADGFLFGPLDLLLFFSYVGLGQGRSIEQVKEDVKRDFIPALVLGGTIWPAVQIANFRFVPVRYQLLYVNLFCLLDSCFLSWIEQQGDASWKRWFTSFQKIEDQKGKV